MRHTTAVPRPQVSAVGVLGGSIAQVTLPVWENARGQQLLKAHADCLRKALPEGQASRSAPGAPGLLTARQLGLLYGAFLTYPKKYVNINTPSELSQLATISAQVRGCLGCGSKLHAPLASHMARHA